MLGSTFPGENQKRESGTPDPLEVPAVLIGRQGLEPWTR